MAELPLVSPLDRALFLRAQRYLSGVDSSIIAALAGYTVERYFRRGEWLHAEHEPVRSFYFLSEGAVAATRSGRTVFEIRAPGGVGLAHVLARNPDPPGSQALVDTSCLEIAVSSYLQILEDRFPLVLQLARTLSRLSLAGEHAGSSCGESPPAVAGPAAPARNLDLVDRIALARRSALFRESNLTVLAELLRGGRVRKLAPGEVLAAHGEQAEALLLVESGTLRAERGGAAHRLEAGCIGGVHDLFTGAPREEALVAETEALVLEIGRGHFIDVLEDHFGLARDLLAHLARRYVELCIPGALSDPVAEVGSAPGLGAIP